MINFKAIALTALASVALVGCGEAPANGVPAKGVTPTYTLHEAKVATADLANGYESNEGTVKISGNGRTFEWTEDTIHEDKKAWIMYTTHIESCKVVDPGYEWSCQERYEDETETYEISVKLVNEGADLEISYEDGDFASVSKVENAGWRWTF